MCTTVCRNGERREMEQASKQQGLSIYGLFAVTAAEFPMDVCVFVQPE